MSFKWLNNSLCVRCLKFYFRAAKSIFLNVSLETKATRQSWDYLPPNWYVSLVCFELTVVFLPGGTHALLSVKNLLLRAQSLVKQALDEGAKANSFVLPLCENCAVTQLHISEVITTNTPHQIWIVQRTTTREYNYLANQNLIRF